jgi:hypothetical protein
VLIVIAAHLVSITAMGSMLVFAATGPAPARSGGAHRGRATGADAADRLCGRVRGRRGRIRRRALLGSGEQFFRELPFVTNSVVTASMLAMLRVRRGFIATQSRARDADRGGPRAVGARERPLPGAVD